MISKETAEVIISEIEKKIGIKNMMSNNRTSLFVDARRILFYILRYSFKMRYNHIGNWYGKHHATIIHATKDFEFSIKHDKYLKSVYDDVLLKSERISTSPEERMRQISSDIEILKKEYLSLRFSLLLITF